MQDWGILPINMQRALRGSAPSFVKGPMETLIDRTTGTNIGNMTVFGLANAFDGNTNSIGSACCAISASPGYVGKTYVSAKVFARAVIHGANDRGFIDAANPSTTITIYGKNGTPASATDGTALGSVTFTDTDNESAGRTVNSTDLVNSWTSIWAYINGGAASTYCAELVLYEML